MEEYTAHNPPSHILQWLAQGKPHANPPVAGRPEGSLPRRKLASLRRLPAVYGGNIKRLYAHYPTGGTLL